MLMATNPGTGLPRKAPRAARGRRGKSSPGSASGCTPAIL